MYIDLNIHFHLPQGCRNTETGMPRMTSMKFIQIQVHLSISLSENNETRIEFQLFMNAVNISYIYIYTILIAHQMDQISWEQIISTYN